MVVLFSIFGRNSSWTACQSSPPKLGSQYFSLTVFQMYSNDSRFSLLLRCSQLGRLGLFPLCVDRRDTGRQEHQQPNGKPSSNSFHDAPREMLSGLLIGTSGCGTQSQHGGETLPSALRPSTRSTHQEEQGQARGKQNQTADQTQNKCHALARAAAT